jgi:hypothetical protein
MCKFSYETGIVFAVDLQEKKQGMATPMLFMAKPWAYCIETYELPYKSEKYTVVLACGTRWRLSY